MSSLQGLAGLAAAINGGFEGYRDQERRKTQVAEEQARRDQMDRAERDRKALEQANQDFIKALTGGRQPGGLSHVEAPAGNVAPQAQQQPVAQAGAPAATPTLASAMPATPGGAPAPQAPGKQLGGANYSDDALYSAYRTRTDALARAGLTDHFMDSFSKTAALGARIRQGKMAGALARLNAGDATGAADLYGYVNDGKTVESAEPVQVQAGAEPAWKIRIRNHDTGQASDQVITKSQLMSGIQAINDPQKAIEIEAERAKTIFGTDEKIRGEKAVESVKGEEARKTEAVKGNEARKTEGVKGANAIAMEREKGGQARETDKAKRDAETKAKRSTDEALHGLVRDVIGEQQNGPLGGTRIGNEDTMQIAAYARALQESDPAMNDLAAVRASVAEFRKRRPAAAK